MRIGIVCPYEWTVPGGVGAHVRGLAAELRVLGHQVDVLAPAERPVADEHFVGLGGSLPVPYNGSVARIAFGPRAALRVRHALAAGHYDLLHVHEPLSPSVGLLGVVQAGMPVVGTFHANLGRSLALRAGSPLLRRACACWWSAATTSASRRRRWRWCRRGCGPTWSSSARCPRPTCPPTTPRPTCSAPPRSAASPSATCWWRRWPWACRWSAPTSAATATWCATTTRGCWCRRATPRRWHGRWARCWTTPPGGRPSPRWQRPRPSATPGQWSPRTSPRSTRKRRASAAERRSSGRLALQQRFRGGVRGAEPPAVAGRTREWTWQRPFGAGSSGRS